MESNPYRSKGASRFNSDCVIPKIVEIILITLSFKEVFTEIFHKDRNILPSHVADSCEGAWDWIHQYRRFSKG